jgi:hypothetical protein
VIRKIIENKALKLNEVLFSMDSFTYNNLDRHVLCICKTTEEMAFTMTSLYEKKKIILHASPLSRK